MKTNSGIPKPVYCETLTSWISRLVNLEWLDETEVGLVFRRLTAYSNGDPDVLVKCPMLLVALESSMHEAVKYRLQMPSLDLLSFEHSDVYCPRCLESDIAAGRAPSWRVSWRIRGMCVCSFHSAPVLLRRLETSRFTWMNKGWLAFGEYVNSPASRLMVDFAINKSLSHSVATRNLILLHLIQRVQLWKLSKVDRNITSEISPTAANSLLYVWLWQNVERTGASGFARQFFRPVRNGIKTPSTHMGVGAVSLFNRVDIPHLGVAYLLLGIAYGIIDHKEANFIRDVTFSPSWVFPVDRSEVRLVTRTALGSEALKIVHAEVVGSLSKTCLQQIGWMFG